MRDQYAGDVSDMIKYSLLKALARDDMSLGVAWYYNPDHDGRNDGHHIEYQQDHAWETLDPVVWKSMRCLPKRSISAVEQAPIWPSGTKFHRNMVPNLSQRTEWAKQMTSDLGSCNLVFLDPDNGVKQDNKASKRHASVEELRLLRKQDQIPLVFIKFPARIQFDVQERDYHTLLQNEVGAKTITTLRTAVSVPTKNGKNVPRFRWFTIIDHDSKLEDRINAFAENLNRIPLTKAYVSKHRP